MKASEFTSTQQELDEIWSGLTGMAKWLARAVPTDNMKMLGGQAEMQDYLKNNIKGMMTVAGRYQDQDDKPITKKNLQELPLRAIYAYMISGMKLPDAEIDGVMVAASKNRKLQAYPPTKIIKAADMKGDNTLLDVWPGITADNAREILDKLIGIASVRSMEVLQFGGVGVGNQQPDQQPDQQVNQPARQQTQPARQQTQPAAPAATAATGLSADAIQASIDALGKI